LVLDMWQTPKSNSPEHGCSGALGDMSIIANDVTGFPILVQPLIWLTFLSTIISMRAWHQQVFRSLSFLPTNPLRQSIRWYASAQGADASTSITPAMLGRARSISVEHAALSQKLAFGYDTSISKKLGELSTTVNALQEWEQADNSLKELQQLMSDPAADAELRSIASDEYDSTSKDLERCTSELKSSLIPVHPFAHMPCLLELRPGAGGSEAAIFAGDLMKMYQAFCKRHKLRTNLIKLEEEAAMGGDASIQEAVIEIEGQGAYGLLRSEAGVHRVQRVPATESKGRTHTSAVSVLILPTFPPNAADELGANSFDDPTSDYFIDQKDVRTDVMRARGAGGQHVNTTDSAIRLTHTPTNTVVSMQDSRSQHKNREKAWQILRSRIAQARREAREEELAQMRLSVVGVARMGRGDKVRTYNWNQQRVTDHRSGMTIHSLDDCLLGGMSLDAIMQSVRTWMSVQELQGMAAEEKLARKKLEDSS